MSPPHRRPVIAGNWKMNKGPGETASFFNAFGAAVPPHEDRTIIFFPPAVSLAPAARALVNRPDLLLGVQNIHWEPSGAFTGETGGPMAREAGARFALVGHSERRHLFGESDEDVARKAAAAAEAGLTPIVCVGELLEERRAGAVEAVLLRQLGPVLEAVTPDVLASALLAYEPVWAIGTGVNATPNDASEAHAILRARLAEHLGRDAADALPILYGGSVKPDNAAALLAAEGVDGVLVGGASLDPTSFAAIATVPASRDASP